MLNYLRESKVLLYFGNERHNSTVLDAFGEIVNVSNNNTLWDMELAWYSPSATNRIFFYGF